MLPTILCLDIGSGTQDVLYFDPSRELENCPKFVLPTPAVRLSARIRELTARQRPVYLTGRLMGGGIGRAVSEHLKAGLAMAAHPRAALTLSDNPEKVEAMGIRLSETRPAGYTPVLTSDYDAGFWRGFLAHAGLPEPDLVAACAQDHGYHPKMSNRIGRFRLWREFLVEAEGRPEALIYSQPPEMLTRLHELQDAIGGGPVADTGAAAVLGALLAPEVVAMARERGVTLVNVGNSHTIAFLLHEGRMWGVYEQHTGVRSSEQLWQDLAVFRQGQLTGQQVFDDWGHGCMTLDLPAEAQGFPATVVMGPRRSMLRGYDVAFPSPGGDMMLAGAFGLLKGLAWQWGGEFARRVDTLFGTKG